jgi:hypothetical protein
MILILRICKFKDYRLKKAIKKAVKKAVENRLNSLFCYRHNIKTL